MFRNIFSPIPLEPSCASFFEVNGDKLAESNLFKVLPSSSDYSLKDLISAGVKVSPVDPTIIHDSSATLAVARDFIDNSVEPSNND